MKCPLPPLLVAVLALAACDARFGLPPAPDAPVPGAAAQGDGEAVPVRVARPQRQDLDLGLEVQAVIEAERQVAVVARAAGRVARILVEEGDRVAEGAPLAELDDEDYRLREEEARIGLDEARRRVDEAAAQTAEAEGALARAQLGAEKAAADHQRARGSEGAVSRQQIEALDFAAREAQASAHQAELALARSRIAEALAAVQVERRQAEATRAQLQRARTVLVAPIPGVVGRRDLAVGQQVTEGVVGFLVLDPGSLIARLAIPQQDLARLAPDRHLRFTTEATGEASFEGRILRLRPLIDEKTGTALATAALDNTGGRLLPGAYLRGRIVLEHHAQTLTVPKEAVLRSGPRPCVFAVEDGRACRIDVRCGIDGGARMEVLPAADADGQPPLTEETRVVVVGQDRLQPGQGVRVVE